MIKEYGCSDDGFIDFRAWLIAQGKEVYMNALRDPDTLADIEPYGDCCFECLSYVGDYAYEQLTGRSAYDEMEPDRIEKMRDELKKDIVYKDGIQYPREPKDLPRFLPRLCEKYGGPERFLAAPSTWNYDLHEIRRLLDEGKVQDMATKKEKGGGRSVSEGYVIGVDHGYAAMKTVHGSFPSGLVAYEHEPYTQKNVLEYGGTYYVVGSGRQPLQKDKTRDGGLLSADPGSHRQGTGLPQCRARLLRHSGCRPAPDQFWPGQEEVPCLSAAGRQTGALPL